MKSVFISLFIFSLLSGFTILALYVLLIKKILILKRSLDYEKQSYNCLVSSYDGIRAFRHDFSNIMQSISGYLMTNDLDGLKGYYSSIFKDCEEINKLSILNKDVLNSPPVLSLMAEKYHKAQTLGIEFNIEVFTDLKKLNINAYEFTRILGIFLDNSIEACIDCSKKYINVTIAKNVRESYDYLSIENSCTSNIIDTNQIFEKNYSTKPNNTGLGLWKVNKIINKHENLELTTSASNNTFKHILKIYFKEDLA